MSENADALVTRLDMLAAEIEKVACKPTFYPREKVSELVAQGVGIQQISLIWSGVIDGDRVSPFYCQNTVVADSNLIAQQDRYEREFAKFGKSDVEPVVDDDWTAPWEERAEKVNLELRIRLIDRMEQAIAVLRAE